MHVCALPHKSAKNSRLPSCPARNGLDEICGKLICVPVGVKDVINEGRLLKPKRSKVWVDGV